MKKCIVIFYIFLFISFSALNFSGCTSPIKSPYQDNAETQTSEYLRLHIRANSNTQIDQETKYAVRDEILPMIMQATKDSKTYIQAVSAVKEVASEIEKLASEISSTKAELEIKKEEFPTREYNGIILPADIYDAIVINLGSGEGDNWWCVAFPPLCYIDGEEIEGDEIVLKSKFAEIWDKYFQLCEK